MKPGDVILLSGRGELEERLQCFMRSPWNQTALAIPWQRGIALLECTSRPVCCDLQSGRLRTGVQIVAMTAKVAAYKGTIAHRPVAPGLGEQQIQRLTEFALAMWGLPFNFSPYYAVRALHRRNQAGTRSTFFCTELVAAAYQHIGVLHSPPDGRAESNHAPRDFSSDAECLCLKSGYSFGRQSFL